MPGRRVRGRACNANPVGRVPPRYVSRFDRAGRPGKIYQLFGGRMGPLIEELDEALASAARSREFDMPAAVLAGTKAEPLLTHSDCFD